MASASTIISLFVNGLAFGMVYFLFASGLSLAFGLMGVVNFAHGAFYMMGAYFGLLIYEQTLGTGFFFLGLIVGPLAVMAFSMIVERLTLRRLYGRGLIAHVLLTFGLALVIESLFRVVFNPITRQFLTPELFDGSTTIGDVVFPHYRLFVILVGSVVAVSMYLFLEKTRYGLIARAGMMNRNMVEASGVNIDRAYTLMFGIAGFLAGLAGVIAAPLFGVFPTMGQEIIILGFVIVVIGGLGSFRGSVVGALLVALTETYGNFFAPELATFTLFVLMAVVLLSKPSGLFGQSGVLEH